MHTPRRFVHGRVGPGFDVNAPAASILSDRGLAPIPGISVEAAKEIIRKGAVTGSLPIPFATPAQIAAVLAKKPAPFGVARTGKRAVITAPAGLIPILSTSIEGPAIPRAEIPSTPVVPVPIHKKTIQFVKETFLGGIQTRFGQPGSTSTTASIPPIGGPTFAPQTPCLPGFERDASGRCARTGFVGTTQRILPGGSTGFQPTDQFGNAVLGVFGAALEPGAEMQRRLLCPRGTVLGLDDLCYNKRDLRKSERKWNPGTKPVLTGGQVNTLRKAHRIQERMKKLGLTGHVHHKHKKTRKLLR